MERSNRRNTISILHRSCLYTFLCAAPKQATGVTMASRAVLDWQDLSIAGFTDGTHVQLTVADWLRLGGGVERQLDPPASDSGDLREKYSDYSYSYSASEEEVEVEEGPAPSPPVVARAAPPRLRSRTPPYPARDFPNTPPETPAWGSPSGTQGARTPGQSPGPRQSPRPHHRAGGSPPRSEEHSPGCTTQRTRESPS